ncbi:MAG: hypothetical protein B6226_03460 [Candidatus Cloacimonetes bacterium 4572_65]|nr:MAG: hypothetical protein B6226_03460 [Candidatus Cloacimonetes bacterium 4572_65]
MQCKDGVIVPLKEILTNDKYREQRVDILKSISLISNFIPEIDQFLLNEEATPIFLKAESFVDRWFEAMPLLDVLNIILDIPDSLRSVNYPILTLSMKRYSPDLVIDSFMDLVKILEFKWQIKIGDKYVDPDFFFEDVRFKGGIARVAERYVSLIPREITRLYRASRKDVPKFRIMDILRLGIEGKHQGIKINIEPEVLSMFNKVLQVEKQTVPTALTGTLREYQYRGFQWLHHNSQIGVGSIIADDMGLGKTIQVITLLLKDKEMNRKHPALIVVPTSLIFNWEREFQKFAPSMNIGVFHGTKRTMPVGKDVVLTSYGVIRRDLDKLNRENWHYIILDEAQNIKNHKTQQTRYIKQLQGVIRIAMTGTPVENRLSEYWSIMDFLNSGLLGTPTSFQTEFAIPIERERNRDVLEQFLKITGPFILRRVKTDKSIIKDLPDKIMINQYCSLTPKQEKLYNNVVHNIIDDIENNYKGSTFQRKGSIFNLIIALKQVCNHPANYLKNDDHSYKISGKATMLVNLLEQILENNEKCLIFTQYKEMGFIIQSIIREHFKMDSLFLHGGLSRKKRDTIVQDFQNNNKDKIFILSLKAGGTGLNLTRASHVIHYDLWWNPAVENQATDRAYRIGQNKNVNVHRFITTGTFEEKIDRMLESKKELFNISVKQGESWISDMSNEDLKEFLSLKKK